MRQKRNAHRDFLHKTPHWVLIFLSLSVGALVAWNNIEYINKREPVATCKEEPTRQDAAFSNTIPDDWKMYKSKILKTRFQYPPNVNVTENYTDKMGTEIVTDGLLIYFNQFEHFKMYNGADYAPPTKSMLVTTSEKSTSSLTASGAFKLNEIGVGQTYISPYDKTFTLTRLDNMTVAGYSGHVFEGGSKLHKYIFVCKGGKYYSFHIRTNFVSNGSLDVENGEPVDYQKVFNQILSTFRFDEKLN